MSVASENTSNYIDDLPEELLLCIFKWLSLDTLLVCENVCRKWRVLAKDPSLWKDYSITYSGKLGQREHNERTLNLITTHCDHIQCIKLRYVYNYEEIKSVLQNCKNIKSMELIMCRLDRQFETDIEQWPNIRKLNLRNSILLNCNEDITIPFERFQYLNYLHLPEFGLNATNCVSLLQCKYLTHIFIEKIKCLTLEYVRQLVSSRHSIIRALHIYGGNAIDDNCMFMLSSCPKLNDLAIIKGDTLTDKALYALQEMRSLRHLQIWNNRIFSESGLLATLRQPALIQLKSLSLSRIENVTPPVVDLITEYYKNLKFVAVYQCPRIINTDYEKQLKMKFRNIEVVLY